MIHYQIADLINGPFGPIFYTLAEAEKALADEIAAGQAMNDAHGQEYQDAGAQVPSAEVFFHYRRTNRVIAKNGFTDATLKNRA